jgi:hypothetical protein
MNILTDSHPFTRLEIVDTGWMAKLHVRYMVGGRTPGFEDELISAPSCLRIGGATNTTPSSRV